MGLKKNNNLDGQGFHTNPERICKEGKKKSILTDLLKKELFSPAEIKVKGIIIPDKTQPNKTTYEIGDTVLVKIKTQNKQILIKAVLRNAMKGNATSQTLIFERVEGKVKQSTDITTGGDKLPKQAPQIIIMESNEKNP